MLITNELTVAIAFHSIFYCSILWKAMATVNSLVTNILQNILFFLQQLKESHTGLEQFEGLVTDERIFIFGWTTL